MSTSTVSRASRQQSRLLLVVVAAALMCTQVPSLPQIVDRVSSFVSGQRYTGSVSGQLDVALLTVAGVLVWGLALWLVVVLGAAATLRLFGRNAAAMTALRLLAPRTVRVTLLAAAGVSLATGCAAGPLAAGSGGPAGTVPEYLSTPGSSLSIDWPTLATALPSSSGSTDVALSTSVPLDLDWPNSTASPGTTPSPASAGDSSSSGSTMASTSTPDAATSAPPQTAAPQTAASPAAASSASSTAASSSASPAEAAAPSSEEQDEAVTGQPSPAPSPPPAETVPAVGDGPSTSAAADPPSARDLTVVVAQGDSLWRIAADHLPAGASDADIAAEWPRWYAVNHELIGADPDLIEIGWQLQMPTLSNGDTDVEPGGQN